MSRIESAQNGENRFDFGGLHFEAERITQIEGLYFLLSSSFEDLHELKQIRFIHHHLKLKARREKEAKENFFPLIHSA